MWIKYFIYDIMYTRRLIMELNEIKSLLVEYDNKITELWRLL